MIAEHVPCNESDGQASRSQGWGRRTYDCKAEFKVTVIVTSSRKISIVPCLQNNEVRQAQRLFRLIR
jgi:hypothetical protein